MQVYGFSGTMALAAVLSLTVAAWAAHPLLTDDTGTQGTGKYQLEVNGEFGRERETVDGVTTRTEEGRMNATLTVGAVETLDVFVDMPYQWIRENEDGAAVSSADGPSDISLGAKWRFFERDGASFAVKSAVSLPTGDDEQGLGTGRTGYSAFLIAARESGPWGLYANAGYIRNNNTFNEERNLWHGSLAGTCEVAERLKLAANIAIEKDPDRASDRDTVFAVVGMIYGITEDLDLDAGVRRGWNQGETDIAMLAGATFRF